MTDKEKTIDRLAGTLTIEEKAGQLLVISLTGAFAEPALETFIDEYCIGGLRTSPYVRKFIRYLPDGSPGIQNVERDPVAGEKIWDDSILPPHMRAEEYASLLNRLRERAMNRKHPVPLHYTIDYESGDGSNWLPPGLITLPDHMGMGHAGDQDLIRRAMKAVGRQLKAIGFDMVQSPVVDVNTNPRNPEISTRSFSPDPAVVIDCARASLQGLHQAGIIACLKHYPGRGESEDDAHYGISAVQLTRDIMERIHLAPYRQLCSERIVPAVMLAHAIYPSLDETNEIATVSKEIITGILRDEFGFDGLVTTDSMTMGGLMAKYSVGEAVVRSLDAGTDIILLKDDNVLRYEAHAAIVGAVKEGRLTEERIDRSLRRIWSAKWDYGLFENGGVVETDGLNEFLMQREFQEIGAEASGRAIHVLRDNDKLLPLTPDQQILVVDRVTSIQLRANDSWNHPGMFWEFILEHSKKVSYVDYTPDTFDRARRMIAQVIPEMDVLVVTGLYDRNDHADTKSFITGLKEFGKPIVLVTNNPYELMVPEEMPTVVVSYGLLHDTLKAVAEFLFQ